jgi:hypothetical protein
MAKQTINIGAAPNDGTGTPLRTSFDYCNQNFTELYTATGPSGNNIVVPGSATITGDLTVDTSTLKVDSANDRVGIGTASPTAALDILGAFGTSTGAAVIRNNSAANASNISQVQFFAANSFAGSEQVASIHGSNPNAAANNGGALVFSTSLNGTGTTPTERYRIGNDGTATWSVGGSTAMTLNSTGLGVGVSPSYKLDVNGTARIGTVGTAGRAALIYSASASNLTIEQTNNGSGSHVFDVKLPGWTTDVFTVSSGSTTRFTLTGDGNVGVGVTPSALVGATRVEIKGSNSANLSLRSGSANASARDWMVASNVAAFGDFVVRQGASQGAEPNSGTDRMYFDPSGNIIITPTSTPPTLTVNGQIAINATSNTNLRFSYRGSDGVTRVANITLA